MSQPDEPMTTFTLDGRRAYKRACRRLLHVKRMQQGKEAQPDTWLAAVERDDRTDPYEPRPVAEMAGNGR